MSLRIPLSLDFERNRDLDEAAGAADATACPIQAALETRQIPSLRNDRVSGYDEPSPKPGRYG